MSEPVERLLTNVGPRPRALRQQRDMTLTDLAARTGISVSTLSRLEAGQRRPSLELLSLFGAQGERLHVRARPRESCPRYNAT